MTFPEVHHVLHDTDEARQEALVKRQSSDACTVIEGRKTWVRTIHNRLIISLAPTERWPISPRARQVFAQGAHEYHVDTPGLHSRFFQSSLHHLLKAGKSVTVHSLPSELTCEAKRTLFLLGVDTPSNRQMACSALSPQAISLRQLPSVSPAETAIVLQQALDTGSEEACLFAISLSIRRLRSRETSIEPGLTAWLRKDGKVIRQEVGLGDDPVSEPCALAYLALFTNRSLIGRCRDIIGSAYASDEDDPQLYTLAAFKHGFAILAEDYRHLSFEHGPQSAVTALSRKLASTHEELATVECLQSGINDILGHQIPWRREDRADVPLVSVTSR